MEKYSDKFLNHSGKLKTAILGIEFEFFMKDLSFYKTLEILNDELNPVKVFGFREYHPDFKPTKDQFLVTPDLSGGSSMIELITGPLNFYDAKFYLIKIIKFIQKYGYTNEKCSVHFNISFNGEKNLNDLNILKLILNTDEDEVYRYYPSRKDNVYAKSVKKIIPFKEYDFFNIPISVVKNNIKLPNDKYYGINFLHINNDKESQRLEFRYVGGKDYEKNLGQIIYFMEKFVINTYKSIDSLFDSEDSSKLEDFLQQNILNFKNLSKYDNFIVDYPTIQLQIDQRSDYEIVSTFYDKIYKRIYNIVESTNDLKECIINYVIDKQTIEVLDADFKTSATIKNLDFINCNVEGIFEDCFFIGTDIRNSQITKSKLQHSDATNSKIFNCKVEASTLTGCYFAQGYLNGDMEGGVFRSGELGPYATLDSTVKVVTDTDNFFDTSFEEEDKSDSEGSMKGYGKNK
jgi:uncharacterized protein YjbI with pentapeptide repeats